MCNKKANVDVEILAFQEAMFLETALRNIGLTEYIHEDLIRLNPQEVLTSRLECFAVTRPSFKKYADFIIACAKGFEDKKLSEIVVDQELYDQLKAIKECLKQIKTGMDKGDFYDEE